MSALHSATWALCHQLLFSLKDIFSVGTDEGTRDLGYIWLLSLGEDVVKCKLLFGAIKVPLELAVRMQRNSILDGVSANGLSAVQMLKK